MSPNSAYAVLASEIAGAQGQVYHHLVQMPYPGTGYAPGSPPVPPGFPPPGSPPQSSRQTHIVHQPLPTHTGRDPGADVHLSAQTNSSPVPRQQPKSADTTTSTPAAIISASIPTATIITEPLWTEAQDRLLTRLCKDELNSYLEISGALEVVFQVKRGEDAVKKRLAHLKARRKPWSEAKLNQAAQKAMQSLNSVMQEQLTRSLNSSGNGQSVAMRLAVRLELEKMLVEDNGILIRTMQERIMSKQMERNAKYRTAMEQKEHGPEREWERVDGDEDGDQVSQGEDFEVL